MYASAPVGWAAPTKTPQVGRPSRLTPGRARRPTYWAGFTLMEAVLVLAIMMAVLSVVVVLLQEPTAREKVRRTADLVMAEWTTLRVDAMRDGEHRQFRFLPGTGQYEMVFGETSDLKELPEGMVFDRSLKSEDARESVEEAGLGIQTAGEPEIWFYPDGTTSDVQLLIRNELGMQVGLTLRGLTGVPIVDANVPDAEDSPSGLANGKLGETP